MNTAKERMNASDRPTCEFCEQQHGTDADCDEEAVERVNARIDQEEAEARSREMEQDMRNSQRHPSPASPRWESATPGCVDENY